LVDELKTNLFRKNLFEQVLLYIRDWILGNKSSPIIESLNNVLGFDLVSLAESDNTFDQQELTKKLNENSLARFIYNLKKLTTHQLQKQFDDDWNTLGNDLKELYGCKDKKSCFEKYIKDTLNDHIRKTLKSINNKKFLNDYIISDNVKREITTPDGKKVTLNAGSKVELALLDQFLEELGIKPSSSGELREGGINPYYDIYENKDYTNVVRKLFQDFANGFHDNYYTADIPLNDLISYLSPLDAKKSRNINGELRVLDNIAGELESIYDEEIKPFLEKYGLTDEDLIDYKKYKQLEEKAKKDPNLRRDLLKLKKSILTSLKTGNDQGRYMNLLKLRVLGEKFKREGYVPNITQFGSNVTEEKIPFEGSFYDKSNRVIDILARFGGLFNPNKNKTITPEVLHNFLSDEEKFNKLLEKLLGDANAQKDKTDPRIVIEEYLKQHNPNASEDEIVKFVPEEIKKAVKERLTKIGSRIEKNFDKLTKIFEENAENISKEGAGSQILEGMFNQIIKSYSELKGMDKINLSSVYDGIINGLELGQDLSILDKHRLFNDFKKLANSVGICEISIKKGEIKSTQVPSRYIKNFTYMLEVAKRVMPDDGFKRFATSLVTSAFGFTPVGLAFLEEFGVITPKKEKRVLFNTADDLINHTFNRIRNEINIDKMSKNEALEKLTDIIKEFVAEFNKNKDKFRENLGDNDILLEDPLQVLGIGLLKRTEKTETGEVISAGIISEKHLKELNDLLDSIEKSGGEVREETLKYSPNIETLYKLLYPFIENRVTKLDNLLNGIELNVSGIGFREDSLNTLKEIYNKKVKEKDNDAIFGIKILNSIAKNLKRSEVGLPDLGDLFDLPTNIQKQLIEEAKEMKKNNPEMGKMCKESNLKFRELQENYNNERFNELSSVIGCIGDFLHKKV